MDMEAALGQYAAVVVPEKMGLVNRSQSRILTVEKSPVCRSDISTRNARKAGLLCASVLEVR